MVNESIQTDYTRQHSTTSSRDFCKIFSRQLIILSSLIFQKANYSIITNCVKCYGSIIFYGRTGGKGYVTSEWDEVIGKLRDDFSEHSQNNFSISNN